MCSSDITLLWQCCCQNGTHTDGSLHANLVTVHTPGLGKHGLVYGQCVGLYHAMIKAQQIMAMDTRDYRNKLKGLSVLLIYSVSHIYLDFGPVGCLIIHEQVKSTCIYGCDVDLCPFIFPMAREINSIDLVHFIIFMEQCGSLHNDWKNLK